MTDSLGRVLVLWGNSCVAPAASSQSGFCRPEEVTGLGEGGSCGGRFGYDLKMELTEM